MRTVTWTLPCRLTDAELLKHGEALAIERDERNKLVHEAKSTAADFKARIEKRDAEVDRLALIVRDKAESRPVVCELRRDLELGVMETWRTDTGELVATRVLEPHERNLELFPELDDEAAKRAADRLADEIKRSAEALRPKRGSGIDSVSITSGGRGAKLNADGSTEMVSDEKATA